MSYFFHSEDSMVILNNNDYYNSNNEIYDVLTPEPDPKSLYDPVKKYHIFTTRVKKNLFSLQK